MKIKSLIAVSLLFMSFAAAAQFKVVAKAHEVSLRDFRPPLTANGVVLFRACRDCELQRVRVTPNTRYKIKGETVRLMEFRRSIANADQDKGGAITVKHHFESNTIVSLDAWF